MKLTRVTFSKLHEVEGAFGREWVSPGGGGFPKHLIHSYDHKTKTVVFPLGWTIEESIWVPEEGRRDYSVYQFIFKNFCHTGFRRDYVKKIDFVEVDYDPEEFQPNTKLGLLTLRVQRRNKARTDKLIKKYQTAKMVIAERSMESSKVVRRTGRKQRRFPQYLYELVIQKTKWQDFAKELYEQNLVPKTERFAILMGGAVFPRQLAYFKKTN